VPNPGMGSTALNLKKKEIRKIIFELRVHCIQMYRYFLNLRKIYCTVSRSFVIDIFYNTSNT
jgi:hypothetical protein